jgi:hypothetical protein
MRCGEVVRGGSPPFSKEDFNNNSLQFPPFFKGGLGGICGYQGSERTFGKCYKTAAPPLTCHAEDAQRPQNLITTSNYETRRSAQDDKIAFR